MLYYACHAALCDTMPYHNSIAYYYTMCPWSPGALVGFFARQAMPTETLGPSLGPASGTRGWRSVCRSTPRTARFVGHHALAEPPRREPRGASRALRVWEHAGPTTPGTRHRCPESSRTAELGKALPCGPTVPETCGRSPRIGVPWFPYARTLSPTDSRSLNPSLEPGDASRALRTWEDG